MTSLPLDFPGLEAEASRLAHELADVTDVDPVSDGSSPSLRSRDHVLGHARLLADLTRPESQCFWLRALATQRGLALPRVGAPIWMRRPGGYYLSTPSGGVAFVDLYMGPQPGDRAVGIGGQIDSPEGDSEGLRLALCAAFGVTP